MQLEQLKVRNFRCFVEAKLELDPKLNWIVGQNASGKTSLLEALFFLGHGRSFRSNRPDRLIREGAEGFEVVGRLVDGERRPVLGVGRDSAGTVARLAGESLKSMTQAAQVLPVVALDSAMNQLVSGAPGERRRWLDWGVFHVEHEFLSTWRAYQHALRQRNEALKTGASTRILSPWTHAVAKAGEGLHALRLRQFDRLAFILEEYTAVALPEVSVTADLRQGWAEGESLMESLVRHEPRDRELGNTRQGPHRADVHLRVAGMPAEERLSRGQQKMLAGALWLAQVQVYSQVRTEPPLLLIDDLAAELDGENLARFLELLGRQDAQLVLTAIGDAEITQTGLRGGRVFHVEHGALSTETTINPNI